MKSPKRPLNLPNVGDSIRFRPNGYLGTLKTLLLPYNWATVEWKEPFIGPKIVHLFELEKLEESTNGQAEHSSAQ